jgi:hypothetical protein
MGEAKLDIDHVYTWVNPADQTLNGVRSSFAGLTKAADEEYAVGAARYRDNGELKYSLLLAAKFLPFVRNTYVFGAGGEPEWLHELGPRVIWIEQQSVIPNDMGPFFQSDAVEAFIYRIPGLSEHYLYSNDDFFIASPHTAEDFFDARGRARVAVNARPVAISRFAIFRKSEENTIRAMRGRLDLPGYQASRPSLFEDRRLRRLREDIYRWFDLKRRGLPMINNLSHVTQPYTKSLWQSFHAVFSTELNRLFAHRVRSADSIYVNMLYQYFARSVDAAVFRLATDHRTLNRDKPQSQRDRLRRELQDPNVNVTRFCLNDNPADPDDGWPEYCEEILSDLLSTYARPRDHDASAQITLSNK